uniref:BHLH domain-containing protein n=1 Tax=Oreochromis aureus TaxID=47969 RepID=A0A668V0X2_OREAU
MFSHLKRMVPLIQPRQNVSKLDILKAAIEYIRLLLAVLEKTDNVSSVTDFLKNAIIYSQAEGLGSDLWQVNDVDDDDKVNLIWDRIILHHCCDVATRQSKRSLCFT